MSVTTDEGKVIYATNGKTVLSTYEADLTNLSPCSHEEADIRLLLHAKDAVQKGYRKLCIRTVDTGVVVLAIAMFSQVNPDELWLAFGMKSHFRYIPIHEDWIQWCTKLCQFSMHLLDVILCQHLEDEEKRQPGVFPDVTKGLKTSYSWKTVIVNFPCHCWSDLWYYYMIGPVI